MAAIKQISKNELYFRVRVLDHSAQQRRTQLLDRRYTLESSGDVKVDLISSGTARSLVWLLVSFTRSASRRCTRLAQPRRTSSE